jgi:hypothetical protein
MNNVINIAIHGVVNTFHVIETDAPKDYDGFGTFAICEVPQADGRRPLRTVMIREEHEGWQVARYRSGMNVVAPTNFAMEDIAEFLWTKLRS